MRQLVVFALVAGLAGVAHPANGQTTLNSDAAFLTWAGDTGFLKMFGGQYRWGNNADSNPGVGDWEWDIVNGSDVPLSGSPGQFDWTPGGTSDLFDFRFTYEAGDNQANMSLYGSTRTTSLGSLVTDPVNTLLVRAKATSGKTGALRDFRVKLFDGTVLASGDLVGDSDAAYWLFQDMRLGGGFHIENSVRGVGGVELDGLMANRGSDPSINFKVGTSRVSVPEPGSALLLATGLFGMAFARRRREDEVDA